MKRIVLISRVAALANKLDNQSTQPVSRPRINSNAQDVIVSIVRATKENEEDEDEDGDGADTLGDTALGSAPPAFILDPNEMRRPGSFTETERLRIRKVLGAWEEPEKGLQLEGNAGCPRKMRNSPFDRKRSQSEQF